MCTLAEIKCFFFEVDCVCVFRFLVLIANSLWQILKEPMDINFTN